MSATDENAHIAVLGAGGMMGLPMARNLARAAFQVTAWNRSPDKAEPLRQDGARLVDSAAEAVEGADVILTMLTDTDAVLDTVGEAVPAPREDGCIWLQMSTVGEEGAERCAALAAERGLTFVDAPVLGTREPAEQGKLVILASGPEETRERLSRIFDAIGERSMWIGEAGSGSRLKLATNSWILAVVEGAAETLAFAEGVGLDPQLVLDAVAGGPLDLPYLKLKGRAMIERDFAPSFQLAVAAKDAGLVEASADRHDLDLPMLAAIRRRFDEGSARYGDRDLSATYLLSAADST